MDARIDFARSVLLGVGASIPGLRGAFQALDGLITLCEQVQVRRNQTLELCARCADLLNTVVKYQPSPAGTLEAAYDEVASCITKVWQRAQNWAQRSRAGSLLHLKEIQENIEQSKVAIEDCFRKFELATAAATSKWQSEFAEDVRKDNEEKIAYLSGIRNAQEMTNEMSMRGQEDRKRLMEMMQELLREVRSREQQHNGLSQNLYEIQVTTSLLLPDPHLHSGEITDIETRAVMGTGAMDIYRGKYLQREKVAIKVVRAVEGNEDTLRRFKREVGIWQKVWDIDKGQYILPFYGFSVEEDMMRPYMVSPWQENGTALAYVKQNDAHVNHRQMASARGIRVLHCLMDPPENILINAEGNPRIADFGLSKLLKDMSKVPLTQSGAVDARWLAPEVYDNEGGFSLSSDIWSFGMTVLELLTHDRPFSDIKHSQGVVAAVVNGRNPDRPTDPRVVERGLDDELWRLLVQCWSRLPRARPGILEILERLGE
ncbi:hypothetical protein V5O48_011624 [Marasmius crinis-equi]|uniref:Protein kinase domain-containing protein n=1 Tax=Marasmius crinis-equi TaxID=585013 RepID=A0ABR3EUP7_9AGAR